MTDKIEDNTNHLRNIIDKYVSPDTESLAEAVSTVTNTKQEYKEEDAANQIQKDDKIEQSEDKESREIRDKETLRKNGDVAKEEKEDLDAKSDVDLDGIPDYNERLMVSHSRLNDHKKIVKDQLRVIKSWKRDLSLDTKREETEELVREKLKLDEYADVDHELDALEKRCSDWIDEGYEYQKEFINEKIATDHYADTVYISQWKKDKRDDVLKEVDRVMEEYKNIPLGSIPSARLMIARAMNSHIIEQKAFEIQNQSNNGEVPVKKQAKKQVRKRDRESPKPTGRMHSRGSAVQTGEDEPKTVDWNAMRNGNPNRDDKVEALRRILFEDGLTK